ncbi:salutaridinol 7-O-acetyltransferase-like [Cynara cardunculus var. scolymus]|uniref:salutaridinol 7-O-acetyltransferase-like n=1 Tax=Cynara cardunculus var. scolymus TaxID=59895 RepID=UPI000D623A7C|nr:salutaridinol 7-O-acetyltransferase-like [Cynara cardunculus var. scolymus]
MKVSVLSEELIIPSCATPSNLNTYRLSFIDQQLPPYYIPLILYYTYHESSTITQATMTIKLKTALSQTLAHFYPLAGRLVKNQNTIDCADQGVWFSVARVESSLLDIIKCPMIEELNQLVSVGIGSSYTEEQLAIQVNLFDCGGIAIGVCVSHRIADACSFSSFVSHWFAKAKGEISLNGPVLDSAALFPPMESHEYSRNPKDPTGQAPLQSLVTKRFEFSSLAINKLKREVIKDSSTVVNPTKVEVVTALIWKCGTEALDDCKGSVAFHAVNFRRKMEPPLEDHQFGNIFQMASAVTNQTADMAGLVAELRGSFGKIDSGYLKSLTGENGVEIAKANFKQIGKVMIQEGVGVFRFSSWCRFSVNEGDFGWGKPVWISSADFNDENCIILIDSRFDDGIEAWVVMDEEHMKKFEQNAELLAIMAS